MAVELHEPEEVSVMEVTYTESMVRRAVREFMVRRVLKKWELWVLEAVLVGGAIYLREIEQIFWSGMMAGGAVLPVLVVLVVWRAHWMNSVGKFRRMRRPEATVCLSETMLIVQSSEGEAKVPLGAIVEVWRFKEFWMLFLAANSFMTLPVHQNDAETMRILEARLPVSK